MSSRPRLHLLDTLALFLTAFALYRLLGQETFYGPDGRHILKMMLGGLPAHRNHFFYVPALGALHRATADLGLSPYAAGVLLSQLGTAVGVAGVHRACLHLCATRARAVVAAALVATAPAVVFFATVVELHGFFFAFCGAAAWATARFAARPRPLAALLAGVTSGVAVGAHATAWLLPAAFLPLAFAGPRRPVALAALAAAAHVAAALALPKGMGLLGVDVGAGSALTFLRANLESHGFPLAALPVTLWRDWLWPFLPSSMLAFAAWRRERVPTRGLLLAIAAYVAVTVMLQGHATESGAYLLPLAWPAAVLAARMLPLRLCIAAAAAGLALGVGWVVTHDDPTFGRAFAAAARAEYARAPTTFFAGQHREFDAFFIHAPELPWRTVIEEADVPAALVQDAVRMLAAWVRAERASGRAVLMTEGVFEYLADPVLSKNPASGPLLARALREAFDLAPVERGVLRAVRLEPR